MKKNIFILLFTTLTILSCNNKKQGYTITGNIENTEGLMVYLEDISTPNMLIIDTAKIENNAFKITGNTPEGLYRIRLIPTNESIIIYLPENKGIIDLKMDKAAPQDYTVSGNEQTIAIKNLHQELVINTTEYQKLKNKFEQSPDTIANVEEEMGKALDKITNSLKTFISKNENGFLKTYALTILPNPNAELEYIHQELKAVVETSPNNTFAKSVFEEVDKFIKERDLNSNTGLGIGNEVPDIILPDVNGKQIKLSDLRGKVVLIDFWAAWCKPCRAENPNVVSVYTKYKDKGFEVFSVSLDKNKNDWTSAIREDGLYWKTHASDLKFWNSEVVGLYNIKGIPQTFLIDAEGKIIAKNLRGQALENRLAEIFQ